MARKTKIITCTGPEWGRDANKVWFIEEMPTLQGERWARRVVMSIGGNIPLLQDIEPGMGALAMVGVNALGKMALADADELLEELLRCVKRIPDPNKPDFKAVWIADDFEEIATVTKLRWEAFKIHTDFFTRAAPYLNSIGQMLLTKLSSLPTSRPTSDQ